MSDTERWFGFADCGCIVASQDAGHPLEALLDLPGGVPSIFPVVVWMKLDEHQLCSRSSWGHGGGDVTTHQHLDTLHPTEVWFPPNERSGAPLMVDTA